MHYGWQTPELGKTINTTNSLDKAQCNKLAGYNIQETGKFLYHYIHEA